MKEEFECDACHRKFESGKSLNSHYRFCKVGTHITKRQKISKYKINDNFYKCECGKEFENHQSLLAHFSHCLKHKHELGLPEILKNRSRSGNKCNFSKAYLGEDGVKKLHAKSEQTIANNIKNGKHYRFNFDGRIKQGWYKGIYCHSSFELAFVLYCLDNGLNVKACKRVFEYEYEGKKHHYYPDFEIDGIIYEIKGYENDVAKLKHKLFPEIIYLKDKSMKKYLDYARKQYGKDFFKLLKSKEN